VISGNIGLPNRSARDSTNLLRSWRAQASRADAASAFESIADLSKGGAAAETGRIDIDLVTQAAEFSFMGLICAPTGRPI